MADKKISELTALTGANVATDDQLVIVDTSAALTKSITIDEFKNALDTATGFVRITGDTMTGDLSFGDSDKAIFGAGSDLQIYHDGTHSYIDEQGTGSLQIRGTNLNLKSSTNETYLYCVENGEVGLQYDNALKLATTSTGIDVTGNATFADNGKAIFGAGSDLQIYHDGNSYIKDLGAGNLSIMSDGAGILMEKTDGENIAFFDTVNSNVYLFESGIKRLETTSTGVEITGTLTSDGLTVGDGHTIGDDGFDNLVIESSSGENIRLVSNHATLPLDITSNTGLLVQTVLGTDRLFVDNSTGDISFYEDTGTTAKFFWSAADERLGIGTSSPDSPLTVQPAAQGIGTNATQNWMYSLTSGSEYDLKLNQVVSSGLVKYAFDLRNNGTSYANNLVLDRGNVGIGTSTPHDLGSSFAVLNLDGSNGGAIAFSEDDNATDQWLIYTNSDDSLRFAYGSNYASEAMRIDSSGVVNIKNTGSTADFISETATSFIVGDGSGTQAMTIYSGTANNGAIYFADGSTGNATYRGGVQYLHGSDAMRFYTAAAEAMRIDSSGTTSFHGISGRATGSTGHLSISEQTNNRSYLESATTTTSSMTLMAFINPNGSVGSISVSGSSTSFNTSSDYRLKENVVELTGATDRIKQIPVHRFNFIADADTTVDGFLAHEVQGIVPEAVTGAKDAMRDEEYEVTPAVTNDDGNVVTEAVMGTRSVPDYQGIDQSKLVPLLVATIKELEARITALENT